MALTKILDKLVQIGPGYLDQTLRTYVAENRHYRFYTDTANNKSYAVAAFFTSGELVLNESKKTDILIVAGGGGSSIGNLSGGSGAGKVVNIEEAMLPAEHFLASVGAGGAGGTLTSGWQTNIPPAEGIGNVGNDSSFGLHSGTNTIIANGGGVGGFRQVDTRGLQGGSGGGAGGADLDASGVLVGSVPNFEEGRANTTDPTVTTALSSKYYSGNVFSYGNDGGDSDPWEYYPSFTPIGQYTYHAGGGGGAGTAGGIGLDTKGGDGGDGISIPWVNEVFKEVYHFDKDIYWGGGGGGASSTDEEPGNGGLGGGGGGASLNSVGDTDQKIYRNGKGGTRGINDGWAADKLLGGSGGKNTGGGAGGSTQVNASTTGHIPNEQGNHGGSGFVLIRIHLDDAFSPYSASL